MMITLQIHFTSLYKVARLPAPASTETLPGTSPMSFAKNIHSFIHSFIITKLQHNIKYRNQW